MFSVCQNDMRSIKTLWIESEQSPIAVIASTVRNILATRYDESKFSYRERTVLFACCQSDTVGQVATLKRIRAADRLTCILRTSNIQSISTSSLHFEGDHNETQSSRKGRARRSYHIQDVMRRNSGCKLWKVITWRVGLARGWKSKMKQK